MYKFKTKYKYCLSTIDELQYVRPGESAPNSFKENSPKQKQANYNISNVVAISAGKYIPVSNNQLTGKGVNNKEKIWNEITQVKNTLVDGYTAFGILTKFNKRRLLKKDGIIYDLTS